ncbi:carbohydrate ABC transporter permease [Thermotalea metallivorans]|uniref:L-arabinose transport system permease protein AraP n=1 Tax=Thermotalea metallivorans TaxID=520762 RepID=A0A140L4G6_9FIRM|nr:sugar ABC transporter permease [Thermotalea metallivorans]KXG75441.1 L-arabinose transport system permease protein AraP [Thermotalea metallivorans]
MKRFLKKYYLEFAFILPLTLYILGFTILPISKTIWMSFQDPTTGRWGLSVYRELFRRPDFVRSIFHTVVVTLIELTIQMTLGLLIAMALKQDFKGKGLARSLVLLPMGVPTLVAGVALIYIFGTQGYLNELLFQLGFIKTPVYWTSGGIKSLFTIAFADSWKVMPMVVLLFLAGLESIPSEIYEAGSIDGATKLQSFRHITLPLLKPTVTMVILLRAVDVFRIFELPLILVGRATPFLATFAYDEYRAYNNLHASAAASTVLLICIILFMYLYFRYVDKGGAFGNGK